MNPASFDEEVGFGEVCGILEKLEKPSTVSRSAKRVTKEARTAARDELVGFFEDLRQRLTLWKRTHALPDDVSLLKLSFRKSWTGTCGVFGSCGQIVIRIRLRK